MEWRLFVPVLDCERLKQPPGAANAETLAAVTKLEQFYTEILGLLDQLLPSTTLSEDVETRKDSYLVGSHFFGAKYRSGEKLEVKCKAKSGSSASLYGIETWKKSKFGKKEIHHQLDQIISYLTENGYCQSSAEVEECRQEIIEAKFVEVAKSRKKIFLSSENISFEFCELFVSFPSSLSTSTATSPMPRSWISFCIESNDENSMISFLKNSSFFHSLFRSLSAVLLHVESVSTTTVSSPFIWFTPMVCGYPLWVRHLGRGDGHWSEEERSQSQKPLSQMFHEKGFVECIGLDDIKE
jgi:hypothetical protein